MVDCAINNCLCGIYIDLYYYSSYVCPDKYHQSKRHTEIVKLHSYGVVWLARPFGKGIRVIKYMDVRMYLFTAVH